jgi:hypothetical protein
MATARSHVQSLAKITLELVALVRERLPLEGAVWPLAGEGPAVVLQPIQDLGKRLCVFWWVHDGKRFRTFTPAADDPAPLHDLVSGLLRLFNLYGWTLLFGGTFYHRRPVTGGYRCYPAGWQWPAPPEVDPALLEQLRRAANDLLPGPTDGRGGRAVSVSPALPVPAGANGEEQTAIAGLTFSPGGFRYKTADVRLNGKPLIVLKSVAESRSHTRTAAELYDLLYGDKEDRREVATVRTHVAKARKALREALRSAGVAFAADPLPRVDRGPALAWKLADLPRAASTEN